jgi:siroheme synthase-like protein
VSPAEPRDALPPLYPVGLVLEGRRCLVVGGGAVARRKVEGLLACGALVTVVAPEVDPGLAALAVTVERRPYRRADLDGVRLAFAASDDPAVNRAVYDDGEAVGVWVNAADQPDACAFTLPAVLRHEPVVVAVSTGGRSPALARHLRDRVATVVGPDDAALARRLGELRDRLHAEGSSTEGLDWEAVIRGASDVPGPPPEGRP